MQTVKKRPGDPNLVDFWPEPGQGPGRTEAYMAVRAARAAFLQGRIVGGVFLRKHDIWRWVPIRNVSARGGTYQPDPLMMRGIMDMCRRDGWTIGAIFHNEWSKVRSKACAIRRWEKFTPLELHWLPGLGAGARGAASEFLVGRRTARFHGVTREVWRVRL